MVLRTMVIYIEREIEREIENWFSDFQRPAVMRSKNCLDNWSGRGGWFDAILFRIPAQHWSHF